VDLNLVLGTATGLLGVAVSVFIYRAQKRKKIVEYAVVAQTPLVTADAPSSLQLRFHGEVVEDVRLLTIAVANMGTDSIATSDFEGEPLKVQIAGRGDGAPRILSAEVRNPQPQALAPRLAVNGAILEIEPLILNAGDSFGIQMLTAGGEADVSVDGRVVGVSAIRRFDPESMGAGAWLSGLGSLMMICPAVVGIADIGGDSQTALAGGLYVLGIGLFVLGIWWGRKRKRYTRRFFED
jgi:hypothetical protein